MGEDKLPLVTTVLAPPRSDVRVHPLTLGAILSVDGSRRIWALNDTSAFIWRILDEVRSLRGLADRLMAVFPISEERALADARAAVDSFEREGLLGEERPAEPVGCDDSWDIVLDGPRLVEPERWAVRQSFIAANRVFEFCCVDSDLGESFAHQVSHLAVDRGAPCDTRLAVLPGEGGSETWDIYLDDLRFKEGLPRNTVLPHLATALFVRCCEALKEHLLFHAAVVTRDGRAVVFPGEAGSGKTTLTAALMAQGYHVFSDELAVLHLDTLHVSPLPLPMSIKSRSIAPLSRFYPDLADRAVHLRSDGKKVRYLSPRPVPHAGNDSDSAAISSIVFPVYRQGAENRLVTLDETEALQRLARTGSSNRNLTCRDVEAMVSLVKSYPRYELVYSDVCGAVTLLKQEDILGSDTGGFTECAEAKALARS